jgi:GNAT-like C-terminal domain/N-acyltransferase N-terminal domain
VTEAPEELLGLDVPDRMPPRDLVTLLRALVVGGLQPNAAGAAIDELTSHEPDLLAAFAAVTPDALARHRSLGVPPAVTRAGFRDVGRKHHAYGATTVTAWLIGILRADVLEFGRLQVERLPGPHGHALHIPEGGPLTPRRVDDSLAQIRGWVGSGPLSCTSWILDAAIREELPTSNLAAFARRFDVVELDDPEEGAGGEAVSKFVFRRSLRDVLYDGALIPKTSLEQVVAARLRAGYRWSQPVGVLAD